MLLIAKSNAKQQKCYKIFKHIFMRGELKKANSENKTSA